MFVLCWKTEYMFPQTVQVLQQMQPAVFRIAGAHCPRTPYLVLVGVRSGAGKLKQCFAR